MLYITVHLYGKSGQPGEFRNYEQKALDIFKKYGGEIIVAYAPRSTAGGSDTPDEIQVLRIPDQAGFDRFMSDPVRAGLADERNAVIRRTEVYLSDELVVY